MLDALENEAHSGAARKERASMKFTLEIDLGNDAMQTSAHVADALRLLSRKIQLGGRALMDTEDYGKIMDDNGNSVGRWEVTA